MGYRGGLAEICARRGDHRAAWENERRALRLRVELGAVDRVAYPVIGWARIAQANGARS